MKKFAILVSSFPVETETFVWKDALEMLRQGADFRIYSLQPPKHKVDIDPRIMERVDYAPSFLAPSLWLANLLALLFSPLRYLGALAHLKFKGWRPPAHFFKALGMFPKFVWFARLARRQGIHHLHAHFISIPCTMAYYASRVSGIPFSFTFHSVVLLRVAGIQRDKIRAARFIRTVSDYNRGYLLEHFDVPNPDRVTTIRNGFDFETFEKQTEPVKHQQDSLLYVGRLELELNKGLRYLFQAVKLMADEGLQFRLTLIGAGPEEEPTKAYGRELGITEKLNYLGALPNNVVGRWMRRSIFVLPSLFEGLPQTLVEAMAAGAPVVSTRITGIPELVDPSGGGILVPPKDPRALADALTELLQNPDKAQQMGEAGRRFVREHYPIEKCVGALLREIENA